MKKVLQDRKKTVYLKYVYLIIPLFMVDFYEFFVPRNEGDIYDKIYVTDHYCERAKERYKANYNDYGQYIWIHWPIKKFVKSLWKWMVKNWPWSDYFFVMDKLKYKHIFYRKNWMIYLVTIYNPWHANYNLKNALNSY